MAEWVALLVFEALSLVLAVVEALVCALSGSSRAVVPVPALALVAVPARGVTLEQAVGVLVAQGHLALAHLASAEKVNKRAEIFGDSNEIHGLGLLSDAKTYGKSNMRLV